MIKLPSLLLKNKAFFLLMAILALLLLPPFAFAERGSSSISDWETAVQIKGEYNKESFDDRTFIDIVHSLTASIIGCLTCPAEEKAGALQQASTFMVALYDNPPVSGMTYLASVTNRLGIAKPVYAQDQGIGFRGLQPILPLWRVFRNIAYVGFVLVFVVTGFAIMLRIKMSPQAVVTIQSAIPRIVIALLLVTFSYAIAGFLVDLSYVLFFFVISALEGFKGITPEQATRFTEEYTQAGFIDTLRTVVGQGVGGITNIIKGILPGI